MKAPDFKIQHMSVHVPRDQRFTGMRVREDGLFMEEDGHIVISTAHMRAISLLHHFPDRGVFVYVIGSPIYEGRVDRERTAQALARSTDPEALVRTLNGEFLILIADTKTQDFKVYTDRFSSYPFFWAANSRKLYGSYNYTDLARACRDWPGFALRPSKAYEFFRLQRLTGLQTHDNISACLPSAGVLELGAGKDVTLRRYWRQNYEKSTESFKDMSARFPALIANAVGVRRNPDGAGVFLSGGHDSRIVACYARENTTCYTLGFSDNFEVACARKIAQTLGHAHVYIELPDDYFTRALDQATYLSGGMYANDHALFVPAGAYAPSYRDVLLHGHGLDYMFQGMYLHARNRNFLGRPTYIKAFEPFPDDLARHFMDSISFRLKFPLADVYGQPDRCRQYESDLYDTLKGVEQEGRALTGDASSVWEYMIFHQPSRHYTFTNILSKRLCGEVRTPSFDNDVYAFYMALPDEYRLHADIMRKTLYAASRDVAEIPAGNHGIAAAWGPYRKTAALMGRKALRHITGQKKYFAPGSQDRTWPDRNEYINAHEDYRAYAYEALSDPQFRDFLDFIDIGALQRDAGFLARPYSGALLVSILSYYRFFKTVQAGV